ncbi:hypothetical protein RMCBS344292_11623 [Rhizopus microsporus]|nr:hypothetical protein RMCBS344292_11623 [Rhizopus microsporus]
MNHFIKQEEEEGYTDFLHDHAPCQEGPLMIPEGEESYLAQSSLQLAHFINQIYDYQYHPSCYDYWLPHNPSLITTICIKPEHMTFPLPESNSTTVTSTATTTPVCCTPDPPKVEEKEIQKKKVNKKKETFPSGNQGVAVSVNGQTVQLQKSSLHPNIFSGTAPFGSTYQYVITDGQNKIPETTTRKLTDGITSTGNEFFNRSQTIYNVPALPQAFNPVYPTLFTNMNQSNEVSTIIMTVNATQLEAFNKNPLEKLDDAQVTELAYINSKEVYKFANAGLSTSGQSTKDFAKQSWAIELDKYNKNTTQKSLLFGRTTFKLRAEETDSTFAREKLVLDMLAAAGGATLSASWTRVFINNEPYGLFLLMDDVSTHLIDNVLHGGNWKSPNTGVTYKGNALNTDDLPALPAYTAGTHLDANGNVVSSNGSTVSTGSNGNPSGNGNSNNVSTSTSAKSTSAASISRISNAALIVASAVVLFHF